MKHIKDPVHGYIDMNDADLSIMNHPDFQRLRRIKQLGFSSTVYPSATHTRFVHSLGVMYLSSKLADSIDLSEKEKRDNMIAGLLHDIGHLPFSHTLEPLLEERQGIEHEDFSCEYIDELESHKDVQFQANPDNVKDIIKGEYSGINLISNEIDCDRLDYLLRDSYNTGIELGQIEHDTLIKFAKNFNGELGFNHKSLRSVERLLNARMEMNYSVYSHDTVTITETMTRRATENHLDETDTSILELKGLTDNEMENILENSESNVARELYDRIKNRRLYKSAYFNSLNHLNKDQIIDMMDELHNIKDVEREIADMAGVEEHKVLISPPKYSEINEFQTPVRMPDGNIRSLEKVSAKPKSLRESALLHQNIIVSSPPKCESSVNKSASEYFDYIKHL